MNFFKYQATGNDFILINNMDRALLLNNEQIIRMCDRHFGIGSDGLILLEPDDQTDFHMVFYNPDASVSFCGNGSRSAVQFAMDQGICEKRCSFRAIDGIHSGEVYQTRQIAVRMRDVAGYEPVSEKEYFIHTGSPHHLVFTEDLYIEDFYGYCRNIRYSQKYSPGGTNVNLIRSEGSSALEMRTYERGVESETLSCGTGVTAAALGLSIIHHLSDGNHSVHVKTSGGNLEVCFIKNGSHFSHINLIGPAEFVFKGEITL